MSKELMITIFTDPTCPFAYSAEPTRWRLKWLYGDQISWQTSMIVLSGYNGETSPMTPERISGSRANLRDLHGMPMDIQPAPRVPQSILACRNYIAVRRHAPELAEKFLQNLRIATMSNELIDEQKVLDKIIDATGLDCKEAALWIAEPETEIALAKDAEAARHPGTQAIHFTHKLSTTSTNRVRYPAPSYIFSIDGSVQFELPGFWPLEAYEAAIGNVLPGSKRAADPKSVEQILEWAGIPLATIEIAKIYGRDISKTRKELEEIAAFSSLGQDGFWTLR
jgi:predicted DsbA family dithiol-disulfide isomerase